MSSASSAVYSLFSSLLLIVSLQLSASAHGQTDFTSPVIFAGTSIKAIDRTTPQNQEKKPAPQPDNSSDSMCDLDDDAGLDDLSADDPMRTDHDTQHFSITDLDSVGQRTPGTIHVFLIPVNSFYCLHEHIRERAPPMPG